MTGEHQSKLTLMSESLRNDGRIWVPKKKADTRAPDQIPEDERDYYLERKYPSFGNLAPRDIASRAAKQACDDGRGVGKTGLGVYLDFKDAIARLGEATVRERYGNLFDMYELITDENPYKTPMRIYPATHYTMGGLWVDYNLMSTIPGLHVIGEANFSDHGANRLGASALMQGLADGYFVLPYTIGHYLASNKLEKIAGLAPRGEGRRSECRRAHQALPRYWREADGRRLPPRARQDHVGVLRHGPQPEGVCETALQKIPALREEFWSDVKVLGTGEELNQSLEKAGRVADFMELGELMCRDALERDESCGCHFREEHQTEDGECKRDDEKFAHAAVWEHTGEGKTPRRNVEPLTFENVHLQQRSYK